MIIRPLLITLLFFINSLNVQADEFDHIKVLLQLKSMSYNIRVPVDKAPNDWSSRKSSAWQVIEKRQPDVIGFQEMVEHQRDDLLAQSDLYKAFGDGRDSDRTGESCTIFYRQDKWHLDTKDSGTFWYSSTPEVSGSMDWANDYIRIATWVRLINKESGQGVYVYNTHWDFREDFQLKAVKLLTKKIAERKFKEEPYIVMGDLNAVPNSKAVTQLLGGENNTAFIDVWLKFTNKENSTLTSTDSTLKTSAPTALINVASVPKNSGFTFHGFSGEATRRIDYIFSSEDVVDIKNVEVITDHKAGHYPTDHFPLMAELVF